jgi:glycosyltransferase involved in cell wall biosynthesis
MTDDPTSAPVPRYSVIIPAYNEAEELPATLASVRQAMALQDMRGELVVVDNNSVDDTAAVARGHGADQVVFEPVNQIARARNAGAAQCSSHYLVFVDADTRICAELLRASLALMESEKFVGGGSVIQFEGKIRAVGRFAIGLWECVSKLTNTAAGSYLFCRNDAFREVGGFDEKLFASEEIRFSRLLRKWGRGKGLGFKVLRSRPAQTSARKLEWYSSLQLLGWMLFVVFFPLAVRSRKLCGFWYRRPEVHS